MTINVKPTINSDTAIVNIQGVSKSFGQILALDNLDLSVYPAEVLTILGANGAGKTTLINAMLGRLSLDQGNIELFDFSPGNNDLKRLCGAMLQVSDVPDMLTVREHIKLFQCYYPQPMPYQQVIEYADLQSIENRYSSKISGGQKQRLLFALAICGNPALLFLDEPSAGMDVSTRNKLWQAIELLKEHGTSIILTTHYLAEADALSDRIVMLNKGKIIHQGTPEQIKSHVANKIIRFKRKRQVEHLSDLDGVNAISTHGDYVQLQSTNSEKTIKHLVQINEALTDLTITAAALEDAFMQLDNQENLSQTNGH